MRSLSEHIIPYQQKFPLQKYTSACVFHLESKTGERRLLLQAKHNKNQRAAAERYFLPRQPPAVFIYGRSDRI